MLEQTEGIVGLLSELFSEAPVGLLLLDRGLRYVHVNRALAELHGVASDEHLGRTPAEVAPELAAQLEPILDRVLAGEAVVDVELDTRTATRPAGRTTLESFYPLRGPDGEVAGVGGVVVDVSDLRHARDSERYLRELLGEERAVLREVFARAPAGIALLWGPDDRVRLANDRFRAIAALEEDPTGRTFAEALPALWPIARRLLDEVRSTGRPLAREDFAIPAADPRREGAFEGRRYFTFTIDPVSADGVHSGLLIVAHDATEQVRRRARLERELAEERRTASTLQRALLPRSLPALAGAQLAARYEAAGERYEVGGDFYDAFALRRRRGTMLVIGDVCGKGPEAAALTAMARHTIRAEAAHDGSPAHVLQRLNEELLAHEADEVEGVTRFATVACAAVRRRGDGFDVRLSSAGHPDALVVRAGGAVERLASSGPPCGAFAECAYADERVQLRPGDALVLYTDGVLDAGAPAQQLRVSELAAILAAQAGGSAEELAGALAAVVARHGGVAPRDDYAALVFRSDPRLRRAKGGITCR